MLIRNVTEELVTRRSAREFIRAVQEYRKTVWIYQLIYESILFLIQKKNYSNVNEP